MKQLSNKRFATRLERIEKLTDLLETGITPTEAAQQLGVRWETVKADMELIPVLAKGLLSPESCASARNKINKYYDDLINKTSIKYEECLEAREFKEAGICGRILAKLLKNVALLWGLPDAKMETLGAGSFAGGKISFTKVDVNLSKDDLEDIRSVVSRRNGGTP